MSPATKKKHPEPVVDAELAEGHGLSGDEYERICDLLGRTPTYTELGITSGCSHERSRWSRSDSAPRR